jgi:uncharacterized protein YbjT (DUF2867 family)
MEYISQDKSLLEDNMNDTKQVLIFGATGNMGGAAARELLKRGWHVRAVTRKPGNDEAIALANQGAEIFQADMDDMDSLAAAFQGYKQVFSVQNWTTSGVDGEIRQGKLVAEVARSAQIEHLVYGSAGIGAPHSGIPHFDSKIEVEAYMRDLGLPFTILRPTPFMELLSEKEFYPAMAAWGVYPEILGWETPLPWVAVRDIGIAIANIFDDPETWIGRDVTLCGDVKTLQQCRTIFTAIDGRKPFRVPLPPWLFGKLAEVEFVEMWEWMVGYVAEIGHQGLLEIAEVSREVNSQMLDIEKWLKMRRNGGFE